MARTTISLPDSLVKRLEPHKRQINISQICAIALETSITAQERMADMKKGCPVVWIQ
jgi:hypothetical protein